MIKCGICSGYETGNGSIYVLLVSVNHYVTSPRIPITLSSDPVMEIHGRISRSFKR